MLKRTTVILATMVLLTGCAPSEVDSTTSQSSAPTATPSQAVLPSIDPITAAGVMISGELGSEPIVEILADAKPATQLVIADQFLGEGAAVLATSTVLVNYIGIGLTTGQVFESSWASRTPLEISLNQVITGWTQGFTGMKPGGRRLLVIPADLAYGTMPPAGSGIEPNETLIFVVDLIDFK
jgi:peptidylprolyl isomerase